MERNEIIKAYGTDYKGMTKRLLEYSHLDELIGDKNKRIGIKPNLVTPSPASYGATTHPEIVEGIIEYLKERDFDNVSVIEGSWVGDKTSEAFEYCGYNRIKENYKVDLIDTQYEGSFKADCNGMELSICNCVRDIDFLINVPVLKGHCQTKITCALKNMKGLIPNSEKRRFHTLGLHSPIAHLNTYIRQDFIVIDHICGDYDFEEGGNPVIRNCIMTALDPVLVDAYTAKLIGYEPEEIEYIRLAEELKVGSSDLTKMKETVIEGTETEDQVQSSRLLDVSYAVDDADSCSACYGMLIGALGRLKEEGLLERLDEHIGIGQGYRGKTGKLGIGRCTAAFDISIPGCPPEEEDIYSRLKEYILNK